ncbi:MAG: hypothetical protein Q7V63_06235 [Gammaproteobacteria bacterium]|nr:hypothetical protein [Gammaproteobacteria bacterium]
MEEYKSTLSETQRYKDANLDKVFSQLSASVDKLNKVAIFHNLGIDDKTLTAIKDKISKKDGTYADLIKKHSNVDRVAAEIILEILANDKRLTQVYSDRTTGYMHLIDLCKDRSFTPGSLFFSQPEMSKQLSNAITPVIATFPIIWANAADIKLAVAKKLSMTSIEARIAKLVNAYKAAHLLKIDGYFAAMTDFKTKEHNRNTILGDRKSALKTISDYSRVMPESERSALASADAEDARNNGYGGRNTSAYSYKPSKEEYETAVKKADKAEAMIASASEALVISQEALTREYAGLSADEKNVANVLKVMPIYNLNVADAILQGMPDGNYRLIEKELNRSFTLNPDLLRERLLTGLSTEKVASSEIEIKNKVDSAPVLASAPMAGVGEGVANAGAGIPLSEDEIEIKNKVGSVPAPVPVPAPAPSAPSVTDDGESDDPTIYHPVITDEGPDRMDSESGVASSTNSSVVIQGGDDPIAIGHGPVVNADPTAAISAAALVASMPDVPTHQYNVVTPLARAIESSGLSVTRRANKDGSSTPIPGS